MSTKLVKDGYDTLVPYKQLPHNGIQYTYCRDYSHICRHRQLRQVVHAPDSLTDRFMALETPNAFETNADVVYYDVPAIYENRIDIIAHKFLGSARYGWVIALFNDIEDGFTIREGQRLRIPKQVSALFNQGEVLSSIAPTTLNIGSE